MVEGDQKFILYIKLRFGRELCLWGYLSSDAGLDIN
uniref:Uncharacterized protein n=1 Tax=Rhizophora mucronata TaxID=61149 RepID=A0A2P2QBI9_RHIMU